MMLQAVNQIFSSQTCNHYPNLNTAGPPTPIAHIAIADTRCMAQFFTIITPMHNKHIAKHPITIQNPDGTLMLSTHDAEFNIPGWPLAACLDHTVPALSNKQILSISQFCDVGC